MAGEDYNKDPADDKGHFEQLGRWRKIERLRHDALADRNPVLYYRYCNEVGVEPECPELYEQGAMSVLGPAAASTLRTQNLDDCVNDLADLHDETDAAKNI